MAAAGCFAEYHSRKDCEKDCRLFFLLEEETQSKDHVCKIKWWRGGILKAEVARRSVSSVIIYGT